MKGVTLLSFPHDSRNWALIMEHCRLMMVFGTAITTSTDLLARLAIEHCVHGARGLGVLPTTISQFRNGGDNETADLLEQVVYPVEVTHSAAGVKWFRYLCRRSRDPDSNVESSKSEEILVDKTEASNVREGEDEEVIHKFHATVRAHFRGPLKPSFNEAARKAADFGPEWYEPLAFKEVLAE